MTEYKVGAPDAELLGGMIQALWAAFPESFQELIKKIVAKNGVDNIVPDRWYRLQNVMDALQEIEATFGHDLLRQVGEEASIRAPIPPQINSIKACLYALNETFRRFHRGGNLGGYEVREDPTSTGITRYFVTVSTPYPCSLTGGYLEGFARRFTGGETKEILVRHDETSGCRRKGAGACTYVVTCW